MKKIRIDGVIGAETLSSDVVREIESAGSAGLDIEISSIGGSVFQGTEIFNSLRAYHQKYPTAPIEITITGTAASMASYIAAVPGAYVRSYDNATAMYHNPSNFAMGDYRQMAKNVKFLEGLTGLMRKAYAKRSGKSVDEIAKMMDDETWLFGDEIKAAGFADEIIASPESEDQADAAAAIATAQMAYKEMIAAEKDRQEDPERVAAVYQEVTGEDGGREKKTMDRKQHADAVAAAMDQVRDNTEMTPEAKANALARLAAAGAGSGSGQPLAYPEMKGQSMEAIAFYNSEMAQFRAAKPLPERNEAEEKEALAKIEADNKRRREMAQAAREYTIEV